MQNLEDYSKYLNITFSEAQLSQFNRLLAELLEWNTRINLTAITSEQEVVLKHFVDSLTILPFIKAGQQELIDVGSGAGFPGVPIAIMRKDCHVTLCESISKKAAFLEHVKNILGIKNLSIINKRAEDVAQEKEFREKFDFATARAVAYLPTLAEYLVPLVKKDGTCIAQKQHSDDEISSSMNALDILGAKIQEIRSIAIPGLESRDIIVLKKISKTPPEYPRKAGTPSKNPL